jgi:hypothetical protein
MIENEVEYDNFYTKLRDFKIYEVRIRSLYLATPSSLSRVSKFGEFILGIVRKYFFSNHTLKYA